jgi:hypothetical protein
MDGDIADDFTGAVTAVLKMRSDVLVDGVFDVSHAIHDILMRKLRESQGVTKNEELNFTRYRFSVEAIRDTK